MKPNFALSLSYEGISLLHRAFPGWHLVGEIDLDNADLAGDLRRLRDKAIALDPSGLRSKLIIPNDQIRYLRFAPRGAASEDLPKLVEQQLEGATPYALGDLAFDWAEEADTVSVAAVARDTLNEAEAFAREHKFNPVSFVATPESGDFSGEPFFGETAYAGEIAEDGETVERDPVPVRIIGAARLPEPAPVEAPAPPPAPRPEADAADSGPPAPAVTNEPEEPEAVTGFAEPGAVFDAPEAPEKTQEAATDTGSRPADATAFSSIRAHRGDAPVSAPRLDGVARHFTPVAQSAEVVADSLPTDPDGDTDPINRGDDDQARIPPAPPEFVPSEAAADAPPDHSAFTSRRVTPLVGSVRPAYVNRSAEEEQRMTVFGARGAEPVGGKPKHLALILTAVLLLFLAGVAVWASVFLDDGLTGWFRDEPKTITAEVPAPPGTEQPGAEEAGETIASLPPDDTEIDQALREALSQSEPQELTEDEARARYAATGIWLVAPQIPQAPVPDSLDAFYQTSIDGSVTIQDAVALPDAGSLQADERPQTPSSPAHAGTVFALDERGLVIATPQGALSPDGITIYEGAPPVKPPAMPKREVVAEVIDTADPAMLRLAAFRPRTRPDDLTEQNERDNLSGRTRGELAALRPRLRPQSAQEAAELAAQQAAAETAVEPFIDLDAVNSAVTAAVGDDTAFSGATPQAVASSLKPNTRPRNFDRIVRRSTVRESTTVAVSATQRVAPRIPSTASVARQATEKNVLQMRKINLIGVYGAPSSRRALVRLSNGRYRKVKVGDRLDGGKVSAIGDSELRYQKSGRNLVLKMPRG